MPNLETVLAPTVTQMDLSVGEALCVTRVAWALLMRPTRSSQVLTLLEVENARIFDLYPTY
jgi:hypothetical protein